MVNVTQAFALAAEADAANRDFTSRIIILILVLGFNIAIYFYTKNQDVEEDWKKARNFFFNIIASVILISYLYLFPFMLSEGATVSTLIELILFFYQVAIPISLFITIIYFYEFVKNLFNRVFQHFSLRRNYLFGKRRRA